MHGRGWLAMKLISFVMLMSGLVACSNFNWPNTAQAAATVLPGTPQNVLASSGNAQVQVAWGAVSGALSYEIYFSTTPGVTKATATAINTGSINHVHTALTNNTTFYYRIAAKGSGGEGELSAEVSARPAAVRKIFVSSASYTGNMGGIAGANANCQSLAGAAALAGQFRAYISTLATDAACNLLGLSGKKSANCGLPYAPTFDTTMPVQNTFGQSVQTSLFTLINGDGGAVNCGAGNAICTAVGNNESGGSVVGQVRTITTTGGVHASDPPGNSACLDLTLGTNDGIGVLYGTSYDINNWWYSAGWGDNCSTPMRIYCIQQ